MDVQRLRADFPILDRKVHGKRLVYLDSAATTQKPEAVIEALSHYYRTFNANIHRGIHSLAEEATEAYEQTRRKVASFIGGVEPRSIIFTRNATEGLNLVAYAWGRHHVGSGDEILLTEMEHHSNLVPWMLLAREKGAVLKHIPITDEGELRLDCLSDLMTARTKVVSVTLVSNVLGTINPVREIADAAHRYGALMVVDGAQGVPHLPVDVRALDCDFLAFSGHKMLGPTGVGVLYGRPELLMNMEPFLGGGEMIREVRLDRATWNDIPWKFEAGTPNIADVVAFSAALDYLEAVGMDAVRAHEVELTGYGLERLLSLGWIKIYGPRDPDRRGGVLAFNDPEIHAHDLSTILDQYGIAIRAGHHCAQPLMRRLGAAATSRASFYLYNDRDDIDALVEALIAAGKYFGRNTRVHPAG
ncbi:MAG: cysteine desulfurase [Acidobacteria bacterium]|nr:cysteine desulfurase [Acidobacteriota bacterium]